MVTASMNSWRRSAIAFPATEFTESDDGLAGVATTRKPPTTRLSTAPQACPKLPVRAVDGIAAPMKLAPVRHCSRRQRDQSDRLRAVPLSTACVRPSEPKMQERWLSSLVLGAIASAAFSPPGPATITSGGESWPALLDRLPPAERALAPRIEAEGRNAEGGSVHESPARGACPRAGATSCTEQSRKAASTRCFRWVTRV